MEHGIIKIEHYRHDTVSAPEAMVLLIHGLGEHAGRYNDWARRFTDTATGVRLFDLPGHGLSGGKRGVMPEYGKIYDLVESEIRSINEEFPGVPLFLYGHSLGGNIVLGFIVNRRPAINGAIVTSPWVRLTAEPSKIKVALSALLYKILPDITMPSGLNPDHLSHDTKVVETYKSDPLVHDKISPRLFHEAEKAASEVLNNISSIEVPLLLVHGRDDMITSPSGSVDVASGTQKAMLKLWDGGYHELHNEPLKDDHFALISEWMDTLK